MHRDDRSIRVDSEAVSFRFNFQIANGSGREACCVRVEACNFYDAQEVFQQNWQTIQRLARESLSLAADRREIKLTILSAEPALQAANC